MKELTKNPATIIDVALSAGVSVGTVSRVLNGKSNISPENVSRVQKSIENLRYRKLRMGKLVSSQRGEKRTGNIGLVFPEMGKEWSHHHIIAAYACGVERVCQEKGYNVLVEMAAGSQVMPRCLSEGKVDGLLIKATRGIPSFLEKLPHDYPIVGIGFLASTMKLHQVAPDDFSAGWAMAHYLWNAGHRRIAFISTDALHPMFAARLHGYESFMRECRAYSTKYVLVREEAEYSLTPEGAPLDMGVEMDRLLSMDLQERPTALIAANDWMARGLYTACHERGIRIGEDLSVVGFDNAPGLCEAMSPALTSYQVAFTTSGQAAGRALIERVEDPSIRDRSEIQLIRGRIVERGSVKVLSHALSAGCETGVNHCQVVELK